MEDLLKQLMEAEFQPEVIEDVDDFAPIKGAYKCRVKSIDRITGEKNDRPYDFYSLNMEVVETVEGEDKPGRYLKKTYSNLDAVFTRDNGEMNTVAAIDTRKRMIRDLHTAGFNYDLTSEDDFATSLVNNIDKIVCVRASVRKGKQQVKIVNEIKPREEKKVAF